MESYAIINLRCAVASFKKMYDDRICGDERKQNFIIKIHDLVQV